MILKAEDVSLVREGKLILDKVNWEVKSGEHWALIGLNGSGKTMLLNMVNGYSFPSRGKLEVLGHRFGNYDLRQLRKQIGWVSSALQVRLHEQEMALAIVLSGKNATIGLYHQPNQAEVDEAAALFDQFGILELADREYRTLSQGEKQKVLIIRALFAKPQLLILDEPCTGLDIFGREQVLATIEKIGREANSPTMIYVTHHIDEILPMFSQTLLIREGQVYKTGATRQLLDSATFSEFLGTRVEIEWDGDRPWLRKVDLAAQREG